MNRKNIAALLNRAAAAIETPQDLTHDELRHVVEDLTIMAAKLDGYDTVLEHMYTDGTPVPLDACITPDHVVDTFTVQIRSMTGTGRDRVRDLIQHKLEVSRITHDVKTIYARSSGGI